MIMRVMFVLVYIIYCFRIRTVPWKYFQLNAKYFSGSKGIFSKIDIDSLIPAKWRLEQSFDDGKSIPEQYPVFVKPEWGQNAFGIWRADNENELHNIRKKIAESKTNYIIQQAAKESKEFEIFAIPSHENDDQYAVLTVTEAVNTKDGAFPINSINNENTSFFELTSQLNQSQLDEIWSYVNELGNFRISRVCVHANSVEDLVNGQFHLIEINLFVPLPINLLDQRYTWSQKIKFISTSMMALAQITKTMVPERTKEAIFAKKLLYQRKTRAINLGHSREIL